MGLMQKALETYDYFEADYAGKTIEGQKEPLAPVAHMIAKASIEITINAKGEFVQAVEINNKVIIPCTQDSMGRTSSPSPHPLCDQVEYLSKTGGEKYDLYIACLKRWVESPYSDTKIESVLYYVTKYDLEDDLKKAGIKYDKKSLVVWRVLVVDGVSAVYEDTTLQQKFINYYLDSISFGSDSLCMVTGKRTVAATQQLKGIVSLFGNAKIISSNDSTNFTYRGRFKNSHDALTVGYITTQKANNALKWIVSNQGVYTKNRVFICWNPHGIDLPPLTNPLLKSDNNKRTFGEYKSDLEKILFKYTSVMSNFENVVIAAFEAATTGRLSVTYYNELLGSDFMDRLKYWDATCCWDSNIFGVYSPTLSSIINCAFGTERGKDNSVRFETDDKVFGQQIQRLIHCRVDKQIIPYDIVVALVSKCGRLMNLTKNNREILLFTTCAVVKKYFVDRYKEEISMSLEPDKRDRSYQFGRLLAVLEKIENDTYRDGESRETNALKMQSVFVQRPAYASQIIIDKLKSAYYPRLNASRQIYYEKLIGEIMEILSEDPDNFDKPLGPTYLIGYYLQRNALYKKSNVEQEEKEI